MTTTRKMPLNRLARTTAIAGLALAIGAGAMAATTAPAEAGSRTGKYIAAAGLGVVAGAIIANSANRHHGGYGYSGGYYGGHYGGGYGGGYYAPRTHYRYAPPPRVYYEPQGYYAPSYAPGYAPGYATGYAEVPVYGADENYYGGYDCGDAAWNAYDTGSSSTNVGVGGDHCR